MFEMMVKKKCCCLIGFIGFGNYLNTGRLRNGRYNPPSKPRKNVSPVNGRPSESTSPNSNLTPITTPVNEVVSVELHGYNE
jgi:hypothetical protein